MKASLVESQQMSSFVFISSPVPFMLHSCPFMLQSCPFMFLSCSFRVPFMFLSCSCHVPVIFAFISFHFPSLCHQTCRSSKGDMLRPVRSVSVQMLAFLSYVVIVFVVILLSFWRPAQVAIFRVHEHVHV